MTRSLTRTFVVAGSSLALALAAFGVSLSPALAAGGRETFTIYGSELTAQFMNHADDRIRGMSANPFTPDQQALVILVGGQEKQNGPFPGDDVLYTFKLLQTAHAKTSAGSALYTCYYNFTKDATCDVYFELKGGLLMAQGQIRFASTKFTLAVTGGTDEYIGAHGQVSASVAPTGGNLQRLAFIVES